PSSSADLWAPLALDPVTGAIPSAREHVPASDAIGRSSHGLQALGRIHRGVTLAVAEAELSGIAARLAEAFPTTNAEVGARLVPLHEQLVGRARPLLLLLFGAILFVLLIVCANVANLLLARASARKPEIAMRVALGATRGRLVRQLLTESVALAMVGGALGL